MLQKKIKDSRKSIPDSPQKNMENIYLNCNISKYFRFTILLF